MVEDHGRRIKAQKDGLERLNSTINNNIKEQQQEMDETRKSVEFTSRNILTKMDENNKMLEDGWNKRQIETKERVDKIVDKINLQLNNHEKKQAIMSEAINLNKSQLEDLTKKTDAELKELNNQLNKNDEDDKKLQEKVSKCKSFIETLNDNMSQSICEIEFELSNRRQQHQQIVADMSKNSEILSKNLCLIRNDIAENTSSHEKLQQTFDSHKNQVETQNRYNSEEQEKVERVLKHFNETKNLMSSDIELMKNDIRTNENERKSQEKIVDERVEMMKQKLKKHTDHINKIESDMKTAEDNISINKKLLKDDIKIFENKNKETERSLKENLNNFQNQLQKAKFDLDSQFKDEVKGLTNITQQRMKELKGRVDTLAEGDIANANREEIHIHNFHLFCTEYISILVSHL